MSGTRGYNESDEVLQAIKEAIERAKRAASGRGGSSSSRGGNSSNNNGDPDPFNGGDRGSNYGQSLYDALGRFAGNSGAAGQSSFLDFLNVFLHGHDDLSPDVLPTFLEALFNYGSTVDQRGYDYQLTKDQRAYDWKLLQDQRSFDSPQAQLARMMGAGISRDQAIQLLSGSPSASAIGASSPVTGNAAAVSQPNMPNSTDIANSVFNAVSAFSGLVSMGFSAAQAFQQVKFTKNQNFLNNEQIKAYNASSQAYNIIKSSGVQVADDVFSSVGSAAQCITSLADNGNESARAFIQSGSLDLLKSTAPYSSPMLAQLYKDERSASDYATQFRNNMDLLRAQNDLARTNIDNLNVGIKQIEQNIQNLRATEDYTRAQENLAKVTAQLTGKQVDSEIMRTKLFTQQTVLTHEQINQTVEQARGLRISNDVEEDFLYSLAPDNRSLGIDLYTDYRLNKLYGDVMALTSLNERQSWKQQADQILSSYENSMALYELSTLYANGEIGAIESSNENTKDLLYFCRAAENSGLFDYVNAAANSGSAGNFHVGPVGGSQSVAESDNILQKIEKRHKH